MAHTPFFERPSARRGLGLGLLAVMLFFLWVTWAFFTKSFTDYDDVKLVSNKSGLALSKTGDVKLRGMIVGTIRDIKAEDGKVVVTMGMDPELIDRVPRNVRAEIIPKTLFGEKYISLVPTGPGTSESLRAGDTVTDAVVPVEVEKFINDVYPILVAIPPEKISYTLTALANSLEGRGESLGATLDETNEYLKKLNPETQAAVADIVKLGQVSNTYAGQMDNLGELLRNSAKVSRTIVDVEDDLGDFFSETDTLAVTLSGFLEAVDDDLVRTVKNSVQPLRVSAEYSSIFPCWFQGLDMFLRENMDSLLKNKTLHIELFTSNVQATPYDIATERPVMPTEAVIESLEVTQPEVHGYTPEGHPRGLGTVCDELKQTVATGNPVNTHEDPLKIPGQFWKLVGVKNSHNGKLGTDADYNRTPASSNLSGLDSPAQKEVLNRMTTALTGVKSADVPDVASLLISPVIRGAGVSVK